MTTSFRFLLVCFTLSHVSCFTSVPWIPLQKVNKDVAVIPSGSFDTVLNRCHYHHGNLLYMYDDKEAKELANEIMNHVDKSNGRNYWIGVKKYPTYRYSWRWTSGGPFYPDRFNISDSKQGYQLDFCGLLNIFKAGDVFNYSIEYAPCYTEHPAICQAAINPYEAISITAMTLSGICFIIIVIQIFLFIQHKRRSNAHYLATPQDTKDGEWQLIFQYLNTSREFKDIL